MTSPASSPDEDLDLVTFVDNDGPNLNSSSVRLKWKIMIIDDEVDVHETTVLALKDMQILGRDLSFLHAYSSAQAKEILVGESDLALILLDVVMETPHAGLDLVRIIREELNLLSVRVILRTGQPGYAPEIETIAAYDINDYKSKSELTQTALYTSLTVGLRAYEQILKMQQARRGLELIIAGSTELSKLRGLQTFAEGVVIQLAAILNIPPEGLICAQAALDVGEEPTVIAAAGQFRGLIYSTLSQVADTRVRMALSTCLREKHHLLGDQCCLYFSTSTGRGMAAYINCPRNLESVDEVMLSVFCSSICVGMENVLLYSQLVDYAYNDQLLRLPNRLRFLEMIEKHMGEGKDGTLALVDIDDFSGINTTLGHRFGDLVLQSVAHRLGKLLSGGAVLARVSGDTFGVLGPDHLVNPQSLGLAFSETFSIGEESLRVSASFGLVRMDMQSSGGTELVKDAHLALKQAKYRHRGSAQYFTDQMGISARERMRLLGNLRSAFEERSLFVVYQPQVTLANGEVIGAEALVRWRLENGDFVAPDRFIPLAEQSGLIVSLGDFVLRTALHQLHRLQLAGYQSFRMSVNVSQVQLREPGFINSLKQALLDTDVDPENVELEITESMAMDDVDFMMLALSELRLIGVSIAIDDFGTGYSSLSVLRQLPAQRLKIDKAFVQRIEVDAEQSAIAQMVIDLAKCLNMEVIAEGVETGPQQEKLLALGCAQGQGYLFARPMAAEQLEDWLQTARARR